MELNIPTGRIRCACILKPLMSTYGMSSRMAFPRLVKVSPPADVKKFVQLDSTAKNIICGHLTKGQYGRVSALETSKLVWDWLSKVNEGVSTQRDPRISVLRNLFNRFKRNTMRMSSSRLINSLTSQMCFKPSALLRSPSMKSSRHS